MHRRALLSLVVLAAFVVLALPGLFGLAAVRPGAAQPEGSPGGDAAGPRRPTDEALVAAIDGFAARALSAPGAAGLSIAVARGDRVILSKGYGMADLEHGVPATEATLFRIASVTKQYTAAAIMRLAEQGRLSLDDDFRKYVAFEIGGREETGRGSPGQEQTGPNSPGAGKAAGNGAGGGDPADAAPITIRHLLNHTSGIKNYTDLPEPVERGSTQDLLPERVIDPIRTLPLEFEPGTRWQYSNTGYHLLGLVIERVSGRPYAQYLRDEFFTPLGLTRTRYDIGSEVVSGRARGYRLLDGRTANAAFLNMSVPYAAGGLMASAGDLVAWQLALVSGRVVSRDSYTQMSTPATLADGSPTDYGFGMRVRDLGGHPPTPETTRIMHAGGIHGFNSILEYYPQARLSIAVISSSEAVPSGLLAKQIAREALGLAPDYKDLTLSGSEIEALTGKYLIKEIGLDFVVTGAQGKLLIQGTGEPAVPVLAQGGGEFRATWDPSLKIVFDAPAIPGGASPSFTFEQGGETFRALRVP